MNLFKGDPTFYTALIVVIICAVITIVAGSGPDEFGSMLTMIAAIFVETFFLVIIAMVSYLIKPFRQFVKGFWMGLGLNLLRSCLS